MTCDLCKENQATVHFKQICGGQMKEMCICEECARRHGFDVQPPLAVTDFLFGVSAQAKTESADEEKTCDICHMRVSDFKKTSRLGCPHCYEALAAHVAPMLSSMHKSSQHTGKEPLHVGKEPVARKETAGLARLRAELKQAVTDQNFERAAVLRDRIRESMNDS